MESFVSLFLLIVLPAIISALLFMPVFNNAIYIRRFCTSFSLLYFLYSLFLYIVCKPSTIINECSSCTFKPYFKISLPFLNNVFLNSHGIHLEFGVDSLSISMILLTSFIFFLVILLAKYYINIHHKYFYSLILLLESLLVCIFSTTDIFVFFLLWELELIPMYLLISIWGNKQASKSALKFILYTFGGSLFLLLGILLIYYTNFAINGFFSADLTMINLNNSNIFLQLFITLCLLIGFGVKIPIVPLHSWLADTHTNAVMPVSVILAAILLKLGVYGLIRFNIGMLSLSFALIAPILSIFALINIIYGAILSYNQTNIKRLVAFSSISQMGVILLALSSMTHVGYIGAIYHSISHAFISTGLFVIVGIIKQKFRTYNMKRLSGIVSVMPYFYGVSMIIILAALGVPLLSGFIGEFISIYGSFISSIPIVRIVTIFALLILLLSALYLLKFVHNVFYGVLPYKYKHVQDISILEFIALFSLVSVIFLLGAFPSVLINFLNIN